MTSQDRDHITIKPRKRDWPRALRALARLRRDKDDTRQVFEIMEAINANAAALGYQRMLSTPQGGREAYTHLELAGMLSEHDRVSSCPSGSVGKAYADFVAAGDISPEKLAQLSRQKQVHIEERHPHAWFGRRVRDVHDVWHVLTGYGSDALGEECLVAFTYAQTRALGWGLIAGGTALKKRAIPGHPYAAAIFEGYRRGRAAAWLLSEDYDRLLDEPLAAARSRLRIPDAPIYASVPGAARN